MSTSVFPGFPDRLTYLPTPVSFFGSLLRDIDTLAELKVVLYCWRLLAQQKGKLRYVRRSALTADRTLLLALQPCQPDAPEQALAAGLAAACQRGVLIAVEAQGPDGDETCYFLNTPANRQLIEEVRAGRASLGPLRAVPRQPVPAPLPRPSIFELYEQNIGLLTPLIAEELREAELRYPPSWIEDAFREAVAYNKRNWRYIRRILDDWATRGRGDRGETRGHPQPPEDPGAYFRGRYGRFVKR